jgi:A/G-specific adenine glycosylase
MLQQTRVEAVIPYYLAWMARFPTIQALADARLHDVLAAWEGLGYYSRARNLHRAARLLIAQHAGELPAEAPALRSLPGIGAYTAGALASIAFGKDELALDGNLRRVLARLFGVEEAVDRPPGEKLLRRLAAFHLPPGRAGDFNQAWMDLGARVCTPKSPDCERCPFFDCCAARLLETQARLPVRTQKPSRPHYEVVAAVIRENGRVLIAQRPAEGLLGGLWEFPGGKLEPGETLTQALEREIDEELGVRVRVGERVGVYEHGYTHFRVTLHAFDCRMSAGQPAARNVQDFRWVSVWELEHYPMGKIDRLISLQMQETARRNT